MKNSSLLIKLSIFLCLLSITAPAQGAGIEANQIELDHAMGEWKTKFSEDKPMPWTITANSLRSRKIYQVRYKTLDGSYAEEYSTAIVRYCIALDEDAAKLCCRDTRPYKEKFIEEAIDITDQFSERGYKFLRTSYRNLKLSEEENRLCEENFLVKLTENDEIYANSNGYISIKKGTDLKSVLFGAFSDQQIAELTNVTHQFKNNGECKAYRKLFPESLANNNRLLLTANHAWGKKEEQPEFSFDATQQRIIVIKDKFDTNHYYVVPQGTDIEGTFAGKHSKNQIVQATDITDEYSPQGYKKNPTFDLDNSPVEITVDTTTKKIHFGDVELTSLPKNCLILKQKDKYIVTTNEEIVTEFKKSSDKDNRGTEVTQQFDLDTAQLKIEVADPVKTKEKEKTKEKNTDQKTFVANIKAHKTALVSSLGTLTTLGILVKAYYTQKTKALNAHKSPMSFGDFVGHVATHPGKYPQIFAAAGITIVGTLAAHLLGS